MRDFSREDTKVIKGVAILLMIVFHCFAFPDRIGLYDKIITLPFEIHGDTLLMCVAKFGIICLSIYTFLSGYGMYKQYESSGTYSVAGRILGFYKEYWKVFFIFISIAFVFFRNQECFCDTHSICNIFNDISLEKILKDFLGITSNYNREWWFIKTYVFGLILGNVYMRVFSKCKCFWLEFLVVCVFSIFYSVIVPNFNKTLIGAGISDNWFYQNLFTVHFSIPAMFMGVVVAKYDILSKLYKNIFNKYSSMFNIILSAFLVAVIIYIRNYSVFIGIDIIIVPIFIVCILNIFKQGKVGYKILRFVGEHSTIMWLVHSFYCYYFGIVQKLLFSMRVDIIIYIVVVVISLLTSILLKQFYKILDKYLFTRLVYKKI